MKKRYGLIMLLISLIIMTLYPGRFTTFAIFDNSYVHSPYSFLFGFILFFFSLSSSILETASSAPSTVRWDNLP